MGLSEGCRRTPRRARERADGAQVLRPAERRCRKTFGFNYDPSHFGYQGVDYVAFINRFRDRIYHVHMKDVWRSDRPTPSGVVGGHLAFGDPDRFWEFRSLGRGRVNFEEVRRALNAACYDGPLSVEWEDIGMNREPGAGRRFRTGVIES